MLIGHAAISDTRSEPTPKKEYKDLIVRIDQNDKMTEELRKTVILLIQKGKILTKMIQNK